MSIAKKLKKPSDSVLIAEYLKYQRQSSFAQLYKRYSHKVYAKCISMLRDEAAAHDATQDIFIKILLNLSKFSEQSSFSTWVYSITYNYCIDLIRKKKRLPFVFTEDISIYGKGTDMEEIPDSVLLEMKMEHLEQVLEEIPPGDKAILLMKYQDGLSIRDMAGMLEKTESAIKMQIMRAKHKARSILEKINPESTY